MEQIYEADVIFDKNRNKIYEKDRQIGLYTAKTGEQFWEYDKNNRLIYHKLSVGLERFLEYQQNDQETQKRKELWKYPDGAEEVWEYDENNNLIYHRNTDGGESFYKYDKNDHMIYRKNPDGSEDFWEYDKLNRMKSSSHKESFNVNYQC